MAFCRMRSAGDTKNREVGLYCCRGVANGKVGPPPSEQVDRAAMGGCVLPHLQLRGIGGVAGVSYVPWLCGIRMQRARESGVFVLSARNSIEEKKTHTHNDYLQLRVRFCDAFVQKKWFM